MNEKLNSRKLWFTIFWCALIPVGMIFQIVSKTELTYIGQIVTFAGTCTAVYLGIQGYADIKKNTEVGK